MRPVDLVPLIRERDQSVHADWVTGPWFLSLRSPARYAIARK